MKSNVIDLNEYVPDELSSLSTRSWGIALRNYTGIDQFAKEADCDEPVTIVVPSRITALSSSFLEEFFEKSIVNCRGNKSAFLKKFVLKSEGNYNFDLYLKEAFDRLTIKEYA